MISYLRQRGARDKMRNSSRRCDRLFGSRSVCLASTLRALPQADFVKPSRLSVPVKRRRVFLHLSAGLSCPRCSNYTSGGLQDLWIFWARGPF